jgi:hypothetical protein
MEDESVRDTLASLPVLKSTDDLIQATTVDLLDIYEARVAQPCCASTS